MSNRSEIKVNTITQSQAGKKLGDNAQLIKIAADKAGNFVDKQLRLMVSRRVENDIQHWNELKKEIDEAVEMLQRLSKELNQASIDFENVDDPKLRK